MRSWITCNYGPARHGHYNEVVLLKRWPPKEVNNILHCVYTDLFISFLCCSYMEIYNERVRLDGYSLELPSSCTISPSQFVRMQICMHCIPGRLIVKRPLQDRRTPVGKGTRTSLRLRSRITAKHTHKCTHTHTTHTHTLVQIHYTYVIG